MTAENAGLYDGNIQKWRSPCVARENAKKGERFAMRNAPHCHLNPKDLKALFTSPANCFALSAFAFAISSRTDRMID